MPYYLSLNVNVKLDKVAVMVADGWNSTPSQLQSTVRLRFRKSISTTEGLFIVYISIHSLKNMFFLPHERNFILIYGPFSCLIILLFGPIFIQDFVLFSNAHSILKLMRCNSNLPKLDILTLISSDYRA